MPAKRNRLVLLAVAVVVVAATVLAGCAGGNKPAPAPSAPAQAPAPAATKVTTSGATKSNNGGSVTIETKWAIVDGKALVFDVIMDTHSVDLDSYDLKALAMLKDGQGNKYTPTAWDAPTGGHHRSGKLTFALPDSVKQGKAKSITLVIQKVAGVAERVFEWEL